MKLIRYYAIDAVPVIDWEVGCHIGDFNKYAPWEEGECDDVEQVAEKLYIFSKSPRIRANGYTVNMFGARPANVYRHRLWEVEINGRRTYLFDFSTARLRKNTLKKMQTVHYRAAPTYPNGIVCTDARVVWIFVDGVWCVMCEPDCRAKIGAI
jgi:hypothetical protein